MKIGDRVKIKNGASIHEGRIGTIIAIRGNAYKDYGVLFEELGRGHNLGGLCEDGYGWWFGVAALEVFIPKAYHYCNPLCNECMKEPRKAVEFF